MRNLIALCNGVTVPNYRHQKLYPVTKNYLFCIGKQALAFFSALHWGGERSGEEKAVCPSVCLSNAWIVTKLKKVLSRFLYHTKDHLA